MRLPWRKPKPETWPVKAIGKPTIPKARPPRRDIESYLLSALAGFNIQPTKSVYDELQAYVDKAWVYAPAYRIAVCLAQAPFKVYKGDPNGAYEEVPVEHPARRILNNPNDEQSRFDLWEDTGLFLELKGEAPWAVEGLMDGGMAPSNPMNKMLLYVLRPDLLEIASSKTEAIHHYEYDTKDSGEPVIYEPWEVCLIKWRHPKDDYRGLGSARPATDAVNLDKK